MTRTWSLCSVCTSYSATWERFLDLGFWQAEKKVLTSKLLPFSTLYNNFLSFFFFLLLHTKFQGLLQHPQLPGARSYFNANTDNILLHIVVFMISQVSNQNNIGHLIPPPPPISHKLNTVNSAFRSRFSQKTNNRLSQTSIQVLFAFIFYSFWPHMSQIFSKSKLFLRSQWIWLKQSSL